MLTSPDFKELLKSIENPLLILTADLMRISKAVKKYKTGEQPSSSSFWRTQSYEARLEALEQIRKEYNSWRYPAERGIQRVYKIVQRV